MGCYQFQNVVGCIVLDLAGTYVLPTFDIIDADGDGRITQTEFNSGFNLVDKDGNGFVNRDEYGMSSSIPFDTLDILPSSRDNRLSREEWLLSSFDLDGNGVITREDHDPTTGRPLSVWAESPLLGTQQQIGTPQPSSVTSSSTFCDGKSVSTCYGIAVAAHRLMLAATGAASDASRYVQVHSRLLLPPPPNLFIFLTPLSSSAAAAAVPCQRQTMPPRVVVCVGVRCCLCRCVFFVVYMGMCY